MAYNKGNGCYAVSVFNAFAPFKKIVSCEDSVELVAVQSKNYIMREVECGLLYLFGIRYLGSDTFIDDEGRPMLKFYLAPSTVSPENMGAGKIPYIHLIGTETTTRLNFMDNLVALCNPSTTGSISTKNMLIGILKYRQKYNYHAPIALVLNLSNVHYVTVYHLSSMHQTLICNDDGHIYEMAIGDTEFNIVAALEVYADHIFTDDAMRMALNDIFSRDYLANVPVHIINFNFKQHQLFIEESKHVAV